MKKSKLYWIKPKDKEYIKNEAIKEYIRFPFMIDEERKLRLNRINLLGQLNRWKKYCLIDQEFLHKQLLLDYIIQVREGRIKLNSQQKIQLQIKLNMEKDNAIRI